MPPCLPLPRPSSQIAVWSLPSHCSLPFKKVNAGWFPAVPSIQITPWGMKGGKGMVQGISIFVHDVLLIFVPCLISYIPSLSLCIPARSSASTVNQAEGRGEDLCHLGDRNLPPS